MDRKDEIIRIFAKEIRRILEQSDADFNEVQEIRLRAEAPLLLICRDREYGVTPAGILKEEIRGVHMVTREEIRETMEYISSYSLYAFEEELRQGFITAQ